MTNPGLPVNGLVNVTVDLSPPAPSVENVDTCLIVGSSSVIDVNERMREYQSIGAVAADFGLSAPEYLAAVLWFEQVPAPNTLFIGRWAQNATSAVLSGGPNPALLYTAFTGIVSGSFFIVINGVPYAITGLNFGTVTNLNAVANIVQTAIAGVVANSTCVWNGTYTNFDVASGTTGVGSTLSFARAPTAVGNFTFAGQPANDDTITLNGTTVTFVTGTPTGEEVQIGTSLTATLATLLSFLDSNGSADPQIAKFNYYVAGDVLYVSAAAAGTAGDALTIAKSSAEITVSGATLTGATGTDVSGLLGLLQSSSGSYVAQGVAAESALAAVVVLDNQFNDLWYGLAVLNAQDSDYLAIAAYVEADSVAKHYQGVTTQEGGVLVQSDTSDVAYQLQQLGYNHTCVQYSSTNPYAVVSYLARILTTDWSGNNTTIDLMYKQEPGIVAETLSVTQANSAKSKNANIFVNYNNDTAIIQWGNSCSGQPTDTIVGLDWLAITLQANWYATLYESPTKIPQTDPGEHILATVAADTMLEAVGNGLLAPGIWNSGGFGQLAQGDLLPQGFYVYQPPVSSQSETVRATRTSVPFQIAVKLAGAVRTIDGTIFVNA